MEPTFTTETLVVTLHEGRTFADVADRCDVRRSADGLGWVNADSPVDFRMAVLAVDGTAATVRFCYVPGLYDSPKDWLMGEVFSSVVAGVSP